MVAKRKSVGKSPVKSPKKAKTAEQEAVEKIEQAFDGAVGRELLEVECTMLAASLPALATAKEDRHPLETKLAALVGQSLLSAGKSLGQKAAAATVALNERRAVEATAQEGVALAKETLEGAESVLKNAESAVAAAEDAEDAAEDAHAAQQKEEGALGKAQEKLVADAQTFTSTLATSQAKEATGAEKNKLVATLKKVGAPGALVDGIAKAVGVEGGVEALFIAEAAKILSARLAEANHNLGNWEAYVAGVTAKTAQTAGGVEQAKAGVEARKGEQATAKENQKQAKQALKEAEAGLKDVVKQGSAANKASERVLADLNEAEDAGKLFDFLWSRSSAPAETPAAE